MAGLIMLLLFIIIVGVRPEKRHNGVALYLLCVYLPRVSTRPSVHPYPVELVRDVRRTLVDDFPSPAAHLLMVFRVPPRVMSRPFSFSFICALTID